MFAYDPAADGAGGALMMGPTAPRVSGSGTLVYLDASPSLDAALERVVAQGGKIAVVYELRNSRRLNRDEI